MDVVPVVDDWAFLLFWRSRGAEPDRNGVSVQFVASSTFKHAMSTPSLSNADYWELANIQFSVEERYYQSEDHV